MARLTYLNLKHDFDESRIVILPIPLDFTTSYKPGTRDAPLHILYASHQLENLDDETLEDITSLGIYTHDFIEPIFPIEVTLARIEEAVKEILKSEKFLVSIGGEHTITTPIINAINLKFKEINIVQFDAHLDLRESYMGSPYSHACAMRNIIDRNNLIQVGIRAISLEEWNFIKTRDYKPILARDMHKDFTWAKNELAKRLVFKHTYITFDLDFFDPSIMPAVGTPVPGGFLWNDTLELLKIICQNSTVIGFDVVELCPIPYLHSCDFLVASLIHKLLNYVFMPNKIK